MTTLTFDQGTLLLDGLDQKALPPGFVWDERVGGWRTEGLRYRDTVLWLRQQKIPFTDRARQYDPKKLCFSLEHPTSSLQLFDYQQQAVRNIQALKLAGQENKRDKKIKRTPLQSCFPVPYFPVPFIFLSALFWRNRLCRFK